LLIWTSLELATGFYDSKFANRPHRDGTGELANLAIVAAERTVEEVAQKAAENRAVDKSSAPSRARKTRPSVD
jgi:hypothetical protein